MADYSGAWWHERFERPSVKKALKKNLITRELQTSSAQVSAKFRSRLKVKIKRWLKSGNVISFSIEGFSGIYR